MQSAVGERCMRGGPALWRGELLLSNALFGSTVVHRTRGGIFIVFSIGLCDNVIRSFLSRDTSRLRMALTER